MIDRVLGKVYDTQFEKLRLPVLRGFEDPAEATF